MLDTASISLMQSPKHQQKTHFLKKKKKEKNPESKLYTEEQTACFQVKK